MESKKLPNKVFESGVVKIQNGAAETMSDFEKNACLRLELIDGEAVENVDGAGSEMTYKERRSLYQNKGKYNQANYGDLAFILGSAAVVERLWSISDNLIDGERNKTSPILLEALLYLRDNRLYWDDQMIQAAFNETRSQRVRQRLDEDGEA